MADFPGKRSILSKPCARSSADAPGGKAAVSAPHPVLHGRRKGRALGREQAQAWDTVLPKVVIGTDPPLPEASLLPSPLGEGGGSGGGSEKDLISDLKLSPASLFPAPARRCVFEIGFGDGGHLAQMMAQRPADGFIGAEPFRNGIANFLKKIKDGPLDRIRVWTEDAMILAGALADESLDEIYILNPDPWPKARHAKRRLVNPENLDRLARILKPGGLMIMTTDHDALAEWMVTQAFRHPAFVWAAERADDWRTPPPGWIETRYEQKGRAAGRRQSYLIFERRVVTV